jgi:hypothetical protein
MHKRMVVKLTGPVNIDALASHLREMAENGTSAVFSFPDPNRAMVLIVKTPGTEGIQASCNLNPSAGEKETARTPDERRPYNHESNERGPSRSYRVVGGR